MRQIADFHIHSPYSRAVSKEMTLENLDAWATKKGINILGTGDFTHPVWFSEIQKKLEPREPGLFTLKTNKSAGATRFILTAEISSIYTKKNRCRRIHNLIIAPSLETVEKIITQLGWIGNLKSDGRPILGLDAKELLRIVLEIDPKCFLVPAHCLLPNTIVHTRDNLLKPIREIQKGDLVITHNNKWQKVKEIFKRPYSGKIYHIKPRNFSLGLITTPEHPFYAIRTRKNCCWNSGICKPSHLFSNRCKNKYFKDYKPQWIMANQLERGDVLIYPRFANIFTNHREISLKEIISQSILKTKVQGEFIMPVGSKITAIKQRIIIDKNFCKLAGYYLAEGYTNSRDLIGFAFSDKEKKYVDEVISLMKGVFGFDREPKLKTNKSGGIEVLFYSKILYETFRRLFYSSDRIHNASTKSLPNWALGLSLDLQAELFRYWWRGDSGYTASRLLMNQMKIILLRLGIVPSIYVDKRDSYNSRPKHFIEERKIKARYDMYSLNRLSFYEDKFNLLQEPEFAKVAKYNKGQKYGWIDENYIYLPVYDIKVENYKGEVYNLEVEEDNSYVCEFVTVHNCWTPWFSIFGSMSGFNSVEECFEELSDKIFALETGLSCYDEKTEILTADGWKKFTEVRYTDKVCALNSKTEKIEFQKPIKIHHYPYKGKMYRLKTKRVDLLVTPNHKLLFSPCDFRQPPKFFLKEAEFLFNKAKRFKKDGNWVGSNPEYFTLPAVKIKHGSRHYSGYRNKQEKQLSIKPWLKFFGFWIAEGWVSEGKDGDYNVCVCNSKKALLDEMKKILESFGYDVYQGENIVRVRDFQLFHYLKQFGKASEKFIPLEIKSLSKELLEIFFEYYIKGDGHKYGRNKKGLSATTISIKLRDDLQDLALRLGMSAYYKLGYKKGTPILSLPKAKAKGYKQSADSWIIYFIRKNLHTVLPSTIKKHRYIESWIDFDGQVFCVSVPNQVIYVRRNGIPVWCGNSDPAMNWRLSQLDKYTLISNSDAHSPANLGREACVFNIEPAKLSYDEIIRIIKEKDKEKFLYTIEFFPEEGKYHYDGHRLCQIRLSPKETKKYNGFCPVCGKPMTIGVMSRVEELTDREENFTPKNYIPFKSLVPLQEIIAESLDQGKATKLVVKEYEKLVAKGGNEFKVLLDLSEAELAKITLPKIVEGIAKVRRKELFVLPGYDGEYGTVKIFSEGEKPSRQ